MSKPRQLMNKTMKRLKQSNLHKNCHTNKNHSALKKELMCLKRSNSNLKLQLHEQKMEHAALNRKYLHLENEMQQLQLINSALKEENRHYEKLIASTEPDIRSCMTRMVETSQTLAGLQMAFNRNRSRQQLSKIGGSLSKIQSRLHSSVSKSSSKHNKNVLNVAPRRKQAVRPMVQGLQIFTNLTIPLQRISLPTQNSRSRMQVPVVEAPQESESVSIAVEPERPNSVSFEKHRKNLHFVKNMKSKIKHFSVKKEDSRHSKNNFKPSGPMCMVPKINFDDSSESEPEVKRYLNPIVLIRDFNVPSSKNGKNSSLDKKYSAKISSSKTSTSNQPKIIFQDPLEGTSKMFLSPSCSSTKSDSCEKTSALLRQQNCSYAFDSDSDSDNSQELIPSVGSETITNSSPALTELKSSDLAPIACFSKNKEQGSECQADTSNCDRIVENTLEMNLTESVDSEEMRNVEPVQNDSDTTEVRNLEGHQDDVEMQVYNL